MAKVLIVDDHLEIRMLVRASLDEEPYEFFEAGNGAEAIERAQRVRPDIVVLDIAMPGGVDGIAVCAALKQDPTTQHARIVMLTALGQRVDQHRARLAGCDAFINKPFSPEHLARTLQQLLARRGLHKLA